MQNAVRVGGAAHDGDTMSACESAEPLAKKRVAFKQDLVDDGSDGSTLAAAEMGLRRAAAAGARRSPASPPSSLDDPAAPAADAPGPTGTPVAAAAPRRRPGSAARRSLAH